jgi:RNA polymerase sigma factor (sigma-70 family)
MRIEAVGGNGEWIRGALERFEAPLTLYATRLLGDAHRARDVVQEAFLRLCRERRSKVEGRLPAWLYAVARNRAIDERRHDRVAAKAAPLANGAARSTDPASAAETRDSAGQALSALDALPAPQQEAIRLSLQHGLSYADIAEVMRITRNHVAVLVHRGLATLRETLGAREAREVGEEEGETR